MADEKTIVLKMQIDRTEEIKALDQLKKEIDTLAAKGKQRTATEIEAQKALSAQYREASKVIQDGIKKNDESSKTYANTIAGMRQKVIDLKIAWANTDVGTAK